MKSLAHLPVSTRLDYLSLRITARRAYAREKRRTCGRCFERVKVSGFPERRALVCVACLQMPPKRLKWSRWLP